MLETCRILIALDPKLSMLSTNGANGLSLTHNNKQQKTPTPRTNMHVGIALSLMHLAEPPALPRAPYADHVAELITGTSDTEAPPEDRRI